MDAVMMKKKIKASSDKDFKAENGAEGLQTIVDELPVSKEKKKKQHKEKGNGDSMNADFQEFNEIEEKSLKWKKKKREKKTEGDEAEAEEEISEKMDEPGEEDGVSKKHLKCFYGHGKEGFEGTPSKYSGNKEVQVKTKTKRSGEAEIEEKVDITKEQDSKKAAPEEVTSYPDPENREKDSRKKKKKNSDEGNGIEALKNLEDGIEDRTAKEEEKSEKSHKKKKRKRAEGNDTEAVENAEEGIGYGTAKGQDNTEKSPKKEWEAHENVEEKEKKVGITMEQDSKKTAPEEVTNYPDLENREKASRKKKKKGDEGNGIGALNNLEEGIEDRTAKEKEKSEKSHKKKKSKRVEGNDTEAVENSEMEMEYGTAKGEDNTEKSPTKKGEAYENVEEMEKRKKNDEGQCYSNVERNEKMKKKRKRGEIVSDNANRGKSSPADRSPPSKKQKKVTFSDQVEVFLINDTENEVKGKDCDNSTATSVEDTELVWGKRFSKAEDNAIRNAISAYIKERGYEEEKGLHMVLNCMKNSEVRNCWKQIAASLPWRPLMSVYLRAHILYERSEHRGWTKDEISVLKSLQAEHGNNWKKLSEFLGKSRYHVKDKWRRIKRQGLNSGNWSRDEYQKLFDLVNQNLQLKSHEKEEKHTRNVLRDNINWEAIADKMETRDHVHCCKKWYYSLVSSMVQAGEWENEDDITLLRSLLETNASDEEAVDWDALVEGRSDVTCMKRWRQMVKHLGECHSMPFLEKLEMLVKRYIPDLIE